MARATRKSTVVDGFRYDDGYYEALGDPKGAVRILDRLRFRVVAEEVVGASVLDIGAYHGDFLCLMQKRGLKEIHGTEVNDVRMDLANRRIGCPVVRIGFRHGELSHCHDDSVDTVVCMEVLEHVDDLKTAVDEIVRVARRRIIITVPWKEAGSTVLCIYCNRYAPLWGHLRTFDEERVYELLGQNVRRLRTRVIGHSGVVRLLNRGAGVVPLCGLAWLDRMACALFRKGRWLLVVADK